MASDGDAARKPLFKEGCEEVPGRMITGIRKTAFAVNSQQNRLPRLDLIDALDEV